MSRTFPHFAGGAALAGAIRADGADLAAVAAAVGRITAPLILARGPRLRGRRQAVARGRLATSPPPPVNRDVAGGLRPMVPTGPWRALRIRRCPTGPSPRPPPGGSIPRSPTAPRDRWRPSSTAPRRLRTRRRSPQRDQARGPARGGGSADRARLRQAPCPPARRAAGDPAAVALLTRFNWLGSGCQMADLKSRG